MRTAFFSAVVLAGALTAAVGAPKDDLETLRREAASLEALRAEKLENLERREAARWDARYKAAAQAKEAEDRGRALEDAFARLSAEAGRLDEEWVKTRNEAEAKEEELTAAREGFNAFTGQVKRRVDEAASAVSSDIPVELDARTQAYSEASRLLEADSADPRAGLNVFWRAAIGRLDLTRTRSLETRQALFEDGRSASAWRLRLGTVFVAELAKEGDASQLLLRTGSLQGRTFAWRQQLTGDFNKRVGDAVRAAAQGKPSAEVPFDVLQFKSTGSGFTQGEQESA